MIIDVQKVLFIGMDDDKEAFFTRAQRKGCIEFVHSQNQSQGDLPPLLQTSVKAIKILRKQPVVDQLDEAPDVDFEELAEEVVNAKVLHDALEEQLRYTEAEMARIHPLGHFSVVEIEEITRETDLQFSFFCIKSSKAEQIEVPSDFIFITSEYGMDYFVCVSKQRPKAPQFFEIHVEKSLASLEAERQQLKTELSIVHEQLKELATFTDLLRVHFTDQLNAYNVINAIEGTSTVLDETMFAVEAWVPKNKIKELPLMLKNLAVHHEAIAVETTDRVPTYMENSGFSAVGEDLVHIYDTPATNDKDPSLWVLWAFSFFFAMIVADGGYGMIYLVSSLYFRWKLGKEASSMVKRFLTLTTTIASFCVAWGILTGSYFGISLAPDSALNKFSALGYMAEKKAAYHIETKDEVYQHLVSTFPKLAKVTNPETFIADGTVIKEGVVKYVIMEEFYDAILIEFSILVGVIHVCLSLLRYVRRNLSGIGWIACIVGGYLYFPSMLKATSIVNFMGLISKTSAQYFGLQMLMCGVVFAIIVALIQHGKGGLAEITNGIQIFSDILSYLRLYALGLAGMILAGTFNEMGQMAGYAFGFLLIIFGHGINMILGLMGGTIHGLRLNFLEWYHYSFEGGGKRFAPLHLLKRSSS